ncbi:hypothetical protein L3Q82_000678 [Scortum barcoo]|uniref:Uncharacterized protein n=1 Tax=Scortum barcoo TaxID=214431 RepID=A0ACB8WFN9_9TELE|nr:hypothetical protein L3Q82_000678 [Scortum barcoo]
MEDHLQQNNAREVWRGLQAISGQGKNERRNPEPGDRDWANKLNLFFNRFDTWPTSTPLSLSTDQPTSSSLCLHAPSPPSTPPPSLGLSPSPPPSPPSLQCSSPPPPPSPNLFTHTVDQFPKTSRPKEPNHFRPVALTSHLMKALERIVLRHLRPLVSPNMDPLQFAYQPGIGVDDAVIYLLQSPAVSPGSRWKHCKDYLFLLLQRFQHYPPLTAQGEAGESGGQ